MKGHFNDVYPKKETVAVVVIVVECDIEYIPSCNEIISDVKVLSIDFFRIPRY